MITSALGDKELPVYGDGMNIRDWIHVLDHVRAIDVVLHRGLPGDVYNIGGENEKTNLEIVTLILGALGKPETLIRYVKDRPGHDRRYAIDSSKIERELGYTTSVGFKTGMEETVAWYRENSEWWDRIKSGAYLEYYDTMYKNR
jgi:dTDP-glucose 4,6-dehydratase